MATSLLVHTLLGTALVAGGAAALNQVWERETDRLMRRTSVRPLPQGRLGVNEGTWFGVLLTSIGLIELTFGANSTAAVVAFATSASYVLAYTLGHENLARHPGRCHPRCAAAGDRLGRRDRRHLPSRTRALWHRLLLADAALPGDCMDASRRLHGRGYHCFRCSSLMAVALASKRCSMRRRCGR